MKKHHLLISGLLLLICCKGAPEEKSNSNGNDTTYKSIDTSQSNTIEPIKTEYKLKKIEFDFLSECDSLQIWQGGIQGVAFSDSTGPFLMAQCFENKHYDLVVFSDRVIDLKEGANYKENRIADGLTNSEYYAFEIPKKVPENPENEFDTFDYIFPNQVKIYKQFNDGWYLINEVNVDSFEDLGRIKLNTIYKK
ncbi:MAG: hypothetical protein NVV82_12890 [Sporocytophaga sp.]|nr:hypothetical protein [Sporocytophaga sp.]